MSYSGGERRPSSAASYAYYSFPPTPTLSSPTSTSRSQRSSVTPSPRVSRQSRSTTPTPSWKPPGSSQHSAPKSATGDSSQSPEMAPSPTAGRNVQQQAQKTPSKLGKSPASGGTPKLGQAKNATDQAKNAGDQAKNAGDQAKNAGDQAKNKAGDQAKSKASSATSTPKQAPGGAVDRTKQAAGGETKSPKLPPRPKPSQAAQQAKGAASPVTKKTPHAPGGAQQPLNGAQKKAKDTADDAANKADDAADEADNEETDAASAKKTAEDAGSSALDTAEDTAEDTEAATEGATAGEEDGDNDEDDNDEDDDDEDDEDGGKAGGHGDAIGKGKDAIGKAQGVADKAKGAAGKAAEGDAEGAAGDAQDTAEDAADDAQDTAEGAAEDTQDAAGDAADGVKDQLPEPDLSVLKGLEVGEGGQILDKEGNPLGQVDEGDPEDLLGYEIGDEGEILDEDGDVIGRCSILPDKVEELANRAKEGLPGINVLEGLEVGDGGEILGPDGLPLGKITEGDPEDLVGKTLNEQGEILDEDGDVIGRAEVIPGEAADKIKQQTEGVVEGLTPDLSILQGKKVNKKGNILDEEGEPIGKLTEESDKAKCAGKMPNEEGLILDEEGNIVGKIEVVPGEAADEAMKALHPELLDGAAEDVVDGVGEGEGLPGLPGLDILEGLKVNKKGEVLNEDGEAVARLTEGDLDDVRGKKINDKGEILDQDGNVIGKVELIPEAFPEAAEALAQQDLSALEGLKVNKKGEVVNEDGDPVARLIEGELEDVLGKKINDKGEILDDEGNVIGKVELLGQQEDEQDGPDLSILDGYRVNKGGKVVNEDGDIMASLVEGELEDCAGKKINDKGEVLDAEGNVIGRVELEQPEELPPLSILEGCKCTKSGKIVDSEGNPKGELVEGDAKKLAKMGAECDAEGQFWDSKGNVIGRAKTLPAASDEEEAPFAGLEGLIVVEGGFVQDENEHKVGKLVEGDEKKLVGRAVDEDGDVIDKNGNVVGHAERLPEEEEPDAPDLSVLAGLAVNKQGNVIGPDGVPIGRLVEGNPKELAGRKCDEQGQIFNDTGKLMGRCELIPEDEREAKPEGPFAGLEGCVVVKDGYVEDEEGNTVGKVVEGDAKKLVGRAVDEDGDIIDKYGNVKGHAERYEEPEEEVADLSSLEGKIVNKAGNVVDTHGTIFGRIVEGDPKELAGKKVDGKGQIWNDSGKVIGQAELIPGGGSQKPEGPFAGFENLVVAKDGLVTDAQGQVVGKLVEGSDAQKLLGRKVDEDGDILDNTGNSIGKAERYTPEEKERDINPMAGRKVNKDGEVRDENGDLLGVVTDGHLPTLIGKEIDDNGYVIDNDGNRIGECTLMQNLPDEEEEGPTEEELQKQKDAEIAKKMNGIVVQTIEKMQPICKDITEMIEAAERKPKDELDEEELVKQVKPKIEEGNRILQECNGSIRALDPDGSISENAKARSASGEATKEEHQLANSLKELTGTIVTTIENAKKKIADMPHAKKELNPLWSLLTEPLFQILAAVGLLLSGVLGLVGKLLNGLGLGGLVNGLLGGLGIDKLFKGIGLGNVTKSLGLGK